MKINIFISFLLFLGFAFGASTTCFAQKSPEQETCVQLLDWIYKDLTIQNLDKSLERTKKKLLLGLLHTIEKTQGQNLKNHPELLKLWKSLQLMDPDIENFLKTSRPYNRYRFWRNRSYKNISSYDFFNAIKSWQQLQESHPEYFEGMDPKYLLDKWDLITADAVDHISEINYSNNDLKNQIQNLSKQLKEMANSPEKKLVHQAELPEMKKAFEKIQRDIHQNSSALYLKYLKDYEHVCRLDFLSKLDPINLDTVFCPVNQDSTKADVTFLLLSLAELVAQKDLNTLEQPEVPPVFSLVKQDLVSNADDVEQLEIKQIEYQVNNNATYCMRDPNATDTLTIHHTASEKDATPEAINGAHIGRSTNDDPWYMIGYNYVISETSHGGTSQTPSVIQGRSPDITGAHAGGHTRKLSEERLRELSQYKIQCGNNKTFSTKQMTDYLSDGTINANFTSLGIAVIGNYEHKYRVTVGGVTFLKNINGTDEVVYPSQAILDTVAQLACKLQRQYPGLKRLVPHSYFRATNCPGSLIGKLQEITDLANSYDGCQFNSPEYKR